jgi:nitroreductase
VSDDAEFYETVGRRRSVREFQPTPVEPERLQRVLEAGLRAPSHNHLREWEFVLLKDLRRKGILELEPSSHDFDHREIDERIQGVTDKL